MNTLIFNGSPRKNGDTAALLKALTAQLAGKTDVVDCYGANIAPCVDCRACRTDFACVVGDQMQPVYSLVREADNIVVASPIHYSEITGRLLEVMSRLQPGYYARQRGEQGFANKPRRGGILLAGGGDGSPAPAIARARILLRAMNCEEIFDPVMSLRTDTLPAAMDAPALDAARALAARMNHR